jgi:hypothetical protein
LLASWQTARLSAYAPTPLLFATQKIGWQSGPVVAGTHRWRKSLLEQNREGNKRKQGWEATFGNPFDNRPHLVLLQRVASTSSNRAATGGLAFILSHCVAICRIASQFVAIRRIASQFVALRRIRLTESGLGGMEWNANLNKRKQRRAKVTGTFVFRLGRALLLLSRFPKANESTAAVVHLK